MFFDKLFHVLDMKGHAHYKWTEQLNNWNIAEKLLGCVWKIFAWIQQQLFTRGLLASATNDLLTY